MSQTEASLTILNHTIEQPKKRFKNKENKGEYMPE